jgi:hypothetical protein
MLLRSKVNVLNLLWVPANYTSKMMEKYNFPAEM